MYASCRPAFVFYSCLVQDLVSRLTPDNATTNNGVLQVAHSIFRRWRPLFRSDQLFTEILHVLERFGTPFMTLTSVCGLTNDNTYDI